MRQGEIESSELCCTFEKVQSTIIVSCAHSVFAPYVCVSWLALCSWQVLRCWISSPTSGERFAPEVAATAAYAQLVDGFSVMLMPLPRKPEGGLSEHRTAAQV